jgi:allantoinase
MSSTAYLSERVVLPDGVRPACVLVDDLSGTISAITSPASSPASAKVIDLGEHALLPGLVDPHVHINEPGRTEWEGFRTATRAASAGGFTTLIDMPLNCLPETTSVSALEAKRAAAQGKCRVDWRPWGGAVNGNQDHLLALAAAGVPGFKCFLLYPGCDGFGLIDEEDLRRAMPLIARSGLPLLVHAELQGPCEQAAATLAGADWRRYDTYLQSRPDQAEVEAVRLMIALCREFNARVHIVHLSTAEALPLLRAARQQGLPLTVETCPHYLVFNAEAIPDGATLFKCAPPIRSERNRQLLWEALADGTIDLVASDHSPCPPPMKRLEEGSFQTAWGGIAGLSVTLPVLWTEASARGFGLPQIARWMGSAPAALAGVAGRKGRIAPGFDADLVVFAPEETWTITARDLHFRHAVSPYTGRQVRGRVRQTYLRGLCVFDHDTFPGPNTGQEVRV